MTGRFADTLEPEFPAAREHLGERMREARRTSSPISHSRSRAEQFFERREQTFTASYSFKEVN